MRRACAAGAAACHAGHSFGLAAAVAHHAVVVWVYGFSYFLMFRVQSLGFRV